MTAFGIRHLGEWSPECFFEVERAWGVRKMLKHFRRAALLEWSYR